jgi:cycloeucalenol cycloisomerase
MQTSSSAAAPAGASSIPGYWFSKNPDKAWGEKFFLTFIPVFFIYNAVIQKMGWLEVGNFWHVTQNLLMWVPYCVVLPAILRRNSGVRWHESFWFKYNLYMAVYIFYATYFLTEYFFSTLGIRYKFPHVSLYLDSALLGPDERTAAQNFEKIPVGMYLNSVAFFIVYHTASVVLMRRVKTLTLSAPKLLRFLLWTITVAAASYFFAWAETFLYVNNPEAMKNVWYVDMPRMLSLGSACYALYFIVSFPNVFRLDEEPDAPKWSLSRCVIEASFVSMTVMLLLDLFTWIVGPITPAQ